jgi:hypothetical protein
MTTYVTSDPRSSGLAAVVGSSVLYVPAIGPTWQVAITVDWTEVDAY